MAHCSAIQNFWGMELSVYCGGKIKDSLVPKTLATPPPGPLMPLRSKMHVCIRLHSQLEPEMHFLTIPRPSKVTEGS